MSIVLADKMFDFQIFFSFYKKNNYLRSDYMNFCKKNMLSDLKKNNSLAVLKQFIMFSYNVRTDIEQMLMISLLNIPRNKIP